MAETAHPASSFDTSVPNAARMYDFWLGGKDNFAADREAARRSALAVPELPRLARENRKFLGRAVRFCAGAGVTQFLDIGAGLPTMESVHQVAGQVAAEPHVVYVDHDPLVISHARALLATPWTAAVQGDLAHPAEILGAPEVRALIDFSRPVAVLLVAVLHFLPDEADPAGCVAQLRDAMAPGSYLVISHVEMAPGQVAGTQPQTGAARELGEARQGMPASQARDRGELVGYFEGMTLVEPGLTDVWSWRPDEDAAPAASDVMTVVGGVARKD